MIRPVTGVVAVVLAALTTGCTTVNAVKIIGKSISDGEYFSAAYYTIVGLPIVAIVDGLTLGGALSAEESAEAIQTYQQSRQERERQLEEQRRQQRQREQQQQEQQRQQQMAQQQQWQLQQQQWQQQEQQRLERERREQQGERTARAQAQQQQNWPVPSIQWCLQNPRSGNPHCEKVVQEEQQVQRQQQQQQNTPAPIIRFTHFAQWESGHVPNDGSWGDFRPPQLVYRVRVTNTGNVTISCSATIYGHGYDSNRQGIVTIPVSGSGLVRVNATAEVASVTALRVITTENPRYTVNCRAFG